MYKRIPAALCQDERISLCYELLSCLLRLDYGNFNRLCNRIVGDHKSLFNDLQSSWLPRITQHLCLNYISIAEATVLEMLDLDIDSAGHCSLISNGRFSWTWLDSKEWIFYHKFTLSKTSYKNNLTECNRAAINTFIFNSSFQKE